eukprot:m.164723 g.164723  ORF g.164723 m.164723 type:complete len:135 (+) comp16587_c0_seq1:64-468(+)
MAEQPTEAQPDKHTPLPDAVKELFQQARREEIKGDVEAALEQYTTALEQGVAACGEMGLALGELYYHYGSCLLKHTIESAASSASLESLAAATEVRLPRFRLLKQLTTVGVRAMKKLKWTWRRHANALIVPLNC